MQGMETVYFILLGCGEGMGCTVGQGSGRIYIAGS